MSLIELRNISVLSSHLFQYFVSSVHHHRQAMLHSRESLTRQALEERDNLELLLDATRQEPGEIALVASSTDCSVPLPVAMLSGSFQLSATNVAPPRVAIPRQGDISPPADLSGSGSASSTSPTFLTRLADLQSGSTSPEPSCMSSVHRVFLGEDLCNVTFVPPDDEPSAGMLG